MNVRIVYAAAMGLVLATLATVWFHVVNPYVVSRLALKQMHGVPWATTTLHACAKVSANLPTALLAVYVLSCCVILCIHPTRIRALVRGLCRRCLRVRHH